MLRQKAQGKINLLLTKELVYKCGKNSEPYSSLVSKRLSSYTQITRVTQANRGGFTYSKITISGKQDFDGHQVVVKAQNEIYIATSPDNATVYAITPDIITFVDLHTGNMPHNLLCINTSQ